MPNDAKSRSASRAVVMSLLATLLCVATVAQASGHCHRLKRILNPSETALILVDFQYPFTNPAGDSYAVVKKKTLKAGCWDGYRQVSQESP